MRITNPRLIDVFGAEFTQDDVDFAIPRLERDIPLYIDPFLLWASEKLVYKAWHTVIVEFCHRVATSANDDVSQATQLLLGCREDQALGLGYGSRSRNGRSIGPSLISGIILAHQEIPQLRHGTLRHLEELQLVVPRFAEDMVSDMSAAIIKPLLIELTVGACEQYKIPTRLARVRDAFNSQLGAWAPAQEAALPFNPLTGLPLLLVPLDLLRHLPWINYENYFYTSFSPRVAMASAKRVKVAKPRVLETNARNYVEVERYVTGRELRRGECKPDPLFKPLTISTIRTKLSELKSLQTGSSLGADKQYENLITDILSSAFFPCLSLLKAEYVQFRAFI